MMTPFKYRYAALRIPIIRGIAGLLRRASFSGSKKYWEARYAGGRTSGSGSYGRLAEFKAETLNAFVREHDIRSVMEFGCGDGNQLSLFRFPEYVGLDVSKTAIEMCIERFRSDNTKSFYLYDPFCFLDTHGGRRTELTLSLDVIYHLVEDEIFELYMRHLFSAAERFVIIYSSDSDANSILQACHVRYRRFTEWIESNVPEWRLAKRIPNNYPLDDDPDAGSACDFFIYERASIDARE
jgi:hypothetical protein